MSTWPSIIDQMSRTQPPDRDLRAVRFRQLLLDRDPDRRHRRPRPEPSPRPRPARPAAVLGGSIATFMTATIAGVLSDSEGMTAVRLLVVGGYSEEERWQTPTLPRTGEPAYADAFERRPGGKAFHQAVAASHAGVATGLIAAIGDDVIDPSGLPPLVDARWQMTTGMRTGRTALIVDANGQTLSALSSGANDHLDMAFVAAQSDLFDEAKVLLISAEANIDTVASTLELAGAKRLLRDTRPRSAAAGAVGARVREHRRVAAEPARVRPVLRSLPVHRYLGAGSDGHGRYDDQRTRPPVVRGDGGRVAGQELPGVARRGSAWRFGRCVSRGVVWVGRCVQGDARGAARRCRLFSGCVDGRLRGLSG